MTDDETIQALLDKLNEFDKQARGAALYATKFAVNYLGVENERKAHRLISLLEEEGLIDHVSYSEWNLTDKGRHVVDGDGWPIYKAAIEARKRKAISDARLADMKAKGEALQFKYWWVGLAGFAISVLTAGWTIRHDLTDDAPTRAEYNQLLREVERLRESKNKATVMPDAPIKPTALSTN